MVSQLSLLFVFRVPNLLNIAMALSPGTFHFLSVVAWLVVDICIHAIFILARAALADE
jgi:hypothetical protein